MPRIFISHSSRDNAVAVKFDWLAQNGWDDVFLDVGSLEGLAPGEHLQNPLKTEANHCEPSSLLSHKIGLNSTWCRAELQTAKLLGKRTIPTSIADVPLSELPLEAAVDHSPRNIAEDSR
jgi:TIR domain-containing protein